MKLLRPALALAVLSMTLVVSWLGRASLAIDTYGYDGPRSGASPVAEAPLHIPDELGEEVDGSARGQVDSGYDDSSNLVLAEINRLEPGTGPAWTQPAGVAN